MDGERFDALVRGAGAQRTRRAALAGLVGGLLGLGGRAAAAADVAAQGCRVRRCKKGVLRQPCNANRNCCQGLKCSRTRRVCVFKSDHGDPGDFCRSTNDCNPGNFCKKNQCLPSACG